MRDIRLSLDLTRLVVRDGASGIHDLKVQIVPLVQKGDQGKQPAAPWILEGTIRRLVAVRPPKLTFPTWVREAGAPGKQAIAIPELSVKSLTVLQDSSLYVATCASLKSPGTFSLEVKPSNKLPPGPFSFRIPVQLVTEGGQSHTVTALRVEGVMLEDIQAFPSTLFFGHQPLGAFLVETILLRSMKTKAFEVERVQTYGEGIRVESQVLATMPLAKAFRLSQEVRHKGSQSGKVTFFLKSGKKQSVLDVTLQYYGLEESRVGPRR
jgi:hypothetical protein